jgi:hypothetical protein
VPGHGAYGVDRRLRRRHGFHKYSSKPVSLFRTNRAEADGATTLPDGIRIHPGSSDVLWRGHTLVYLARYALERHYGVARHR